MKANPGGQIDVACILGRDQVVREAWDVLERQSLVIAAERRIGCFELADAGTLLLDEIGEMPAPTQAKLLRVLEDRKVRRLGSKSETPVDVRVLAATNKDAEQAVGSGQLREDAYFYTAKRNGVLGNDLPDGLLASAGKPGRFAGLPQLLHRGQDRFAIYCTPCHSKVGDGNGEVVQRGFKHPPSYHEERLKKAPLGYFYDTMTNGFGAMSSYAAQIRPEDRWAIASYIRALQLSQDARLGDVPAGELPMIKPAATAVRPGVTSMEPGNTPRSGEKGAKR